MKKIISIIMSCLLVLAFASCGNLMRNTIYINKDLPYNARIIMFGPIFNDTIPDCSDYFHQEFLDENRISGVSYAIWDEEKGEKIYISEDDAPANRLIIIENQGQYDRALNRENDIDFEQKMLVVYFSRGNGNSENKIVDIITQEGEVTIKYCTIPSQSNNKPGYRPGLPPCRRCIIIEMDKIEYQEIKMQYVSYYVY